MEAKSKEFVEEGAKVILSALIMKPTLLALAVLLASALSPFAQSNQPPTNAAAPTATNTTASSQPTNSPALASGQTNQASSIEIDALLKYQEYLRKETDQNSTRLNELIQHAKDLLTALGWGLGIVGGLIVIVAGAAAWVLNYFGRSTFKEFAESVKTRFDTEADRRLQAIESVADKRVQQANNKLQEIELEAKRRTEEMVKEFHQTSRASFDARIAQIEETYRRRQAKYLKLLRSYFSKIFETNPELRKQWLGRQFDGDCFRGKRILWVDDDGVGIALFVELLVEHCGFKITIRESTEQVLAESLANYDLIISNLRRDPDDNAGVLMASAIRQQKQSKIPIIIFTRSEHKEFYKAAIEAAGVNIIATSEKELLAGIASMLDGKPENGKKA